MKRLFAAIQIVPNSSLLEALGHFQERLKKEKIVWVPPGNWHITLKFFGNIAEPLIADLLEAHHQTALKFEAFTCQLKGCGSFGSPGHPRILWLGLQNCQGIETLYHRLHQELHPLGYQPDRSFFHPHLTIGRIKELHNPSLLWELVSDYQETFFQELNIHRFELYQSVLRPEGPEYQIFQSFPKV